MQDKDNIIIEYVVQGAYVKVTAIDMITHEEVVTIGDIRYNKEALARIAVQKLRLMQQKRHNN